MWVSLDGAAMRIPVHVPWVSERSMGRFQWVGFPWTPLWVVESKSTEKWLQVIHPQLKQGKAKVNLY